MNKTNSLLIIGLVLFLMFSCMVSIAPHVNASATIYSFEPCDFDSSLIFNHGGTNYTTDSWFNHSIGSGGIDNGFLHIGNSAGDNSSRYIVSNNLDIFPPNANTTNSGCLGFWFRPKATSGLMSFEVQWIDSYGTYMAFNFVYDYPPSYVWEYIVTWGTPTNEYQFPGGWTSLTVGNWYWFEIKFFYSGSYTYQQYRNGSAINSYAGVPQFFSASSQVRIGLTHANTNSFPYGFWDIDNIRLANTNEFPPAPTPSIVNVAVSSIPINASVIWEDSVIYSLPHNFSAYNGVSYTITAVTPVSWNASLVYVFEGWSINGSSTINSSNPLVYTPTSNMTLQAIYTFIVISDYSSTVTFGIGLFGFILIGLSWVVGYHFYKEGDYRSMFFWGFLMLIFGYGLIWVIFGG
jgi:hypothetical protein